MIAITNIGQLVTLAGAARPRVGKELGELGLIPNAAILIEEGHIAAVGGHATLKAEIAGAHTVIDAEGRCVTPGFVDAHTHLIFAGNRADEFEKRNTGVSYQEIAAAGGGILRTVALTRAASEDELTMAAREKLRWMVRAGTTTIEAKSGYGLERAAELKMLRVLKRLNEEGPVQIHPTLLAAHTVPPEFKHQRGDYVRWIAHELIPEVALEKLALSCDAFCDDHAFTVDEARVVMTAAKQHGMKLRIHAEQFRPGTGAALAAELGATTADHLETIEPAELKALKRACVQPVLLPGSVFALGRRNYPPARAMADEGLGLVIATDFNPGSSPIASMPFMLSLSCIEMKLTPAEALTAATINAAHSLGLGAETGSIEKGKQANLLIHEFNDYHEIAYYIAAAFRPRVFIHGREMS
jgi:imidazolonepropionase